ncbi:hypothetical protein VSR34_15215 [Paraburkholderia sp. JHI2823]|uniref:hypothetical protein n=1 Tax=Paraburkholderia sp. JHI2823 TaxID=3112960 RepID=UPI00316CFF7B
MNQFGIRLLCPASWGGIQFVRKDADGNRNGAAARGRQRAADRTQNSEQAKSAEQKQATHQANTAGQTRAKDLEKTQDANKARSREHTNVREIAPAGHRKARTDQQKRPERTRDKGWLREL